MKLPFTKMNGAGNDFIVIDNRDDSIRLAPEQIERLCDRQRGVGADGLFLVRPGRTDRAPWAWDFYNNDGSSAEMCGNAARCFGQYLRRELGAKNGVSFETIAGVITASYDGNLVSVNLTPPTDLALDQQLEIDGSVMAVHSLNTGVPHAVGFVDDLDAVDILRLGGAIRRHPHFAPKGTNVNFAELESLPDAIRVRTYERGVEAETLACGTGVCAAAMLSHLAYNLSSPIQVTVQSGARLEVSFLREGDTFTDVLLKGPADIVFRGEIEI